MLGRKSSLFMVVLVYILSIDVLQACTSDAHCSYNQTCVKARYNHNTIGVCTVSDVTSKTHGVKSVQGYVTSSQCEWDHRFTKEPGDIYGLCVKR